MTKRIQVLIVEDEYLEIREAARRRHMTVSEWICRALRKAINDQPETAEAKLRAIVDASRHSFPTADIETMLGEIETGRQRLGSGTSGSAFLDAT